VVATEQVDMVRVFYLVGEEQTHDFNSILASVYKVSYHEILVLWRSSTTEIKNAQKIIKLPMNVSH
jgi:hypothetical protein